MAIVAAGLVAGTGNILLAGVFVAALLGLVIAAFPVALLWIVVIGGLVVAGLARLYVPEISKIAWLMAPVALVLGLHAFLGSLAVPQQRNQPVVPAVIWWALAFIAVTLWSTFVNKPGLGQVLSGLKGYFQVWGVMFALAFIRWPEELIDRLPKVFLVIALLQLPFALHQYLFIVPTRVGLGDGIVPADVIAGTFGGDIDGGGGNAVLAAFLFTVLAGLLGLWRQQVLSDPRLLLLGLPLLIPVLLNEAKVSVVFLVLVFLVVARKDIAARPLRFLGIGLVAFLLLGMLMTVYTMNAHTDKKLESWTDLVQYTYDYNVNREETRDGRLSRWGALKYWAENHGLKNIPKTLFGHGVGATRPPENSSLDFGGRGTTVGIDLSMQIGNTAVPAILWESGVVGLLCVFGMIWAGFRTAGRLARRHAHNPWRAGIFEGIQAAMAVIFVTLWHKRVFVFDVAYQTMIVLVFGYLAYWDRASSRVTAATRAFRAAISR